MIFFSWLALWGVLTQPPNLPPVATVGRTPQPPLIDGDLSDPCWAQAAVLGPLVLVRSADLPTQPTLVRICTDGEQIYVAFRCWEDRLEELRTQANRHDSGLAWADDCVEVFLAPDGKGEVYYHIIVTAANVVDDEMAWQFGGRRDFAWNSYAATATRVARWGWTCELALPIKYLGGAAPQGVWLANFARAEQPHHEWSAWPALQQGFHEPIRFGRLGWQAAAAVTGLRVPPLHVGVNQVSLVTLPGTGPCQLRVTKLLDGAYSTEEATPQQDAWLFTLGEGEGYVRLELACPPTAGEPPTVTFATAPLHFRAAPVSKLLVESQQWLRQARQILADSQAPGTRSSLIRLGDIEAAVQVLRGEVAAAKQGAPTPEEWASLQARAEEQRRQAFLMLAEAQAARRAAPGPVPSFALGWQNSLLKLRRDDTRVYLTGPLALSLARNEWESGQVVVVALAEAVRIAAVTVSPLVNAVTGEPLPGSCVRLWRVGYVRTRPPVYPVEYVGWWPDPLLPVEPWQARRGELQPLWLSVYAPPHARPGEYRTVVTVRAEDGSEATWPVHVRVWNITLPTPSRLKTAFSMLTRGDAVRWYGFKDLPPRDFRLKLYQLLLEHRLNPMSLYTAEMWPPREDLQWCLERGLNAFNIRTVNSDDPDTIAYVREQAEWLRERGWLPYAYIYGFDEVGREQYEALKRAYAAVRSAVPELRRACTVAPHDELVGSVDIWIPLTAAYDPRAAQARRAAGEEVWWYICCGPVHPYCNWFIDYPATDARVIFWQTFKYGVTGFLYYEIAMWRTNLITEPSPDGTQLPPEEEWVREAIAAGKRWPEIPWNTFTFARYNGDGLLIYPGPQQTPLPSLRLEVIRDGIEDYDLLSLLAELRARLAAKPEAKRHRELLATAAQLAAVRPVVVRDLTHYTHDPVRIIREREAVARTILRLQRALGS
jgi:hypothetical protein